MYFNCPFTEEEQTYSIFLIDYWKTIGIIRLVAS